MRLVSVAAILAVLAGPAFAQTAPVQKYGDPDPEKTRTQIDAEKQAEKAYQRSLGNVPNKTGPVDPWGNVRGGETQKAAAKPAPAKRSKPTNPPN